jgi:hypothetical protein
LPEVFSFSETLLQPGATGNVRKSINVISEYDKSFFRKGPENLLFFQKVGFPGNSERIFGIYYNQFLRHTLGRAACGRRDLKN